ncbi:MAG: toprim domain-containing protein [Campylobacterales bacterium]|nr:toprim domain-containing protein [Campylobacterales bacterium]
MTVNIINGSGAGWSPYTLGRHGEREHSLVIMGDTVLGDKICQSVEHYKSGSAVKMVISFAEEDNVTPEQGRKIVKEFLKEYMHGFREDEYHIDVVEHQDTKHLHYHVRMPKLNLLTGTQLKAYYHQSDLPYKIALIDHIAHKYDLIIGTDNKKLVVDPNEKVNQINKWRAEHGQKPFDLSTKGGRGEAEENLLDYFTEMNMQGFIESLDDVTAELKIMGFTIEKIDHDIGKNFDYITVKNDTGKLRLKGDIYGEKFYRHSREDRAKAISDNQSIDKRSRSDQRSGSDIEQALQRQRKRRLQWISKQYGSARKRAIHRLQEEQRSVANEHRKYERKILESSSPYRPLDRRNHRNVGNVLLEGIDRHLDKTGELRDTAGAERHELDRSNRDTKEQGEINNDRVRAEAIGRVRAIRERTSRRTGSVRELSQTISRRTESDNNAIKDTAKGRGHRAEVETYLVGIFQHFGNKFDRFKRAISEANKEFNQRIIEPIKGHLMQELNHFKTSINIAELSTAMGYEKDRDKSTLNAPVMKHPSGDKIVVGLDRSDGHYVYFNPHNDSDKGTVIDFIKNRTDKSLGWIRKFCRAWLHNPQPVQNIKVTASNKDTHKIISLWERLSNDEMILTFRGVGYNTMEWISKSGRVRYDSKEKALYFPMYDINGLCGIEKRTENDKRIIEGSTKGIHTIGNLAEAQRIVIFESPVDMLSYKQLGKGKYGDFYVSTMGSIGESGENSLKAIFERNKTAKIILAVDRDEGGQKIIDKIATISNRDMYRQEPKGKDWNEDLQHKQERTQSRGLSLSR